MPARPSRSPRWLPKDNLNRHNLSALETRNKNAAGGEQKANIGLDLKQRRADKLYEVS
jgi:hypothetical protein